MLGSDGILTWQDPCMVVCHPQNWGSAKAEGSRPVDNGILNCQNPCPVGRDPSLSQPGWAAQDDRMKPNPAGPLLGW